MAYDFDPEVSQRRIDRIECCISAQKLFIISTGIERKAEAALNLRTLQSMSLLLGISALAFKNKMEQERHKMPIY